MNRRSFLAVIGATGAGTITGCVTTEEDMPKDIYGFKAETIEGKEIQLDIYKGKVLLIVNTASNCGFTPQYEGLQKLYDDYKDKDFAVLGFPCNQFGSQEPGEEKEISNFCQVNYGVTFPMFSKIEVNGKNAHPLFKYLKQSQSGVLGERIKWNFTKFLINKKGQPVKRYASSTKPEAVLEDIQMLLEGKSAE